MLVTWSPCHMTLWLRPLDAFTFRNLSLCIIPTADRKPVSHLWQEGVGSDHQKTPAELHTTLADGGTLQHHAHSHCAHLLFPVHICTALIFASLTFSVLTAWI